MISEDKVLRYYSEAVAASHPAPDRAVFGRLGITGGDPSYDSDGSIGLFGVSKSLAASIGMDVEDNADASFKAMMHFDTIHVGESSDIADSMAKTAGQSDVDAYAERVDKATAEYIDKIEWEGGEPLRFKADVPAVPDEELLKGANTAEEVKSKAKELTASYANQSANDASLGLTVSAKSEYDRLIGLLKGTIDKIV